MATKQIVIDIAEINTIRLTCPNEECGAVLEFPLPLKENPSGCPACNRRFVEGTAVLEQFLEYMTFVRSAGARLAFVIPDIKTKVDPN